MERGVELAGSEAIDEFKVKLIDGVAVQVVDLDMPVARSDAVCLFAVVLGLRAVLFG